MFRFNQFIVGARSALLSVCLFGVGIAPPVQAAENTSVTMADFISVPIVSTPSAAPLVMLGMSVDHQLFVKAYSDYSDLDGDGAIDTTYLDRFDYYGYFNSDWCYTYNSGAGHFEPDSLAAGANGHTCNGSTQWSGNFLNWATMTRIDVVRKVLYGGKRSTDNTTAPQTILERANLPSDVHAFAKVWDDNGKAFTPFNKAITLCNVSTSATGAPLIRVADGVWHFWSATEVKQCQWRAGTKTTEPVDPSDKLAEYNARVEVCKAGVDDGSAACRNYGTATPIAKPAGLLQRFGEQGELEFGLISGSYVNKIKGGTLRKNISKIADPVTNNLSVDEINLTTGQFTGVNGVISSIDAFRISGYDYSTGLYSDCDTHSITVNTFKTSTAGDRQCRNWGNPLGEIYLEALRYFAGNTTPSTGFNANDSTIVSGLVNSPAWVDPMTADESCANCAIILLSTGLNSFDQDELASAANIPGLSGGLAAVNSKTDTVGKIEISGSAAGSFSGTYLANDGSDSYCSAKTLPNLSAVKGVCPEVPNLEGGYQVAGLAYHGHIEDLRTASGYDDDQTVETYTVALAETLPSFTIPVGSGSVNFLPACESNTSSDAFADPNWQSCSLFDVKVEKLITVAGKVVYGRYLFFWEDSLWGNDYDIDAIQRIEFCVGTYCNSNPLPSPNSAADPSADPLAAPLPGRFENSSAYTAGSAPSPAMSSDEIMITSSLPHVQAGNRIRVSYSASGITPQPTATPPLANGILTGTAANPKWSTKAAGSYSCIFTGLGTCNTTNEPPRRTTRFTASTSSPAAALLNNPLYYAAKFGNFNDLDGDDTPVYQGNVADTREWDVRDVDGNLSPDGLPDSFFPVSNPASLESSLTRVLTNIIDRTASGTAAAVVANNTTGEGAIYQALYNPVINDKFGNTVNWVGQLQAIFIDAQGNLREDADQDGVLDSCAVDPAVEVFFDTNANETRIRRYAHASCDKSAATITVDELENLGTIWDAREQLSVIANPAQQRVYTAQVDGASSAGGRYIFTSLGGSAVDFTAATVSLSPGNYNYWNTANAAQAQKVVNFIRGDNTISGFRKRSVDYDDDGSVEIWRLGDIVHSTPVVAGQPREGYENSYTDVSYAKFRAAYKDRRQMVYVGANDGMVHAFNGGFWDPVTSAFKTNSGTKVAHPLGAEIWAYVPFNLLPHLKWQAEVDYEHVYYVDGAPKIHDVNIFTPDATHVDGWGTILVVGMRFGGAPVTVDADDNGTIGSAGDETLRSAYMIFDVTNPEVPPVLLAEITDSNLGLTTGVPAIVKKRLPDLAGTGFTAASVDSWILAFGSGPTDLDTITITSTRPQNARLYAYDLATRALVSGFSPLVLSEANSFVGSLTSVDWDLDYLDDAVYFGITGGSAAAATGKLKRVRLDASPWTVADLFVPPGGQPFISAPEAVKDGKGQQWVFAGTGRYYVTGDTGTTQQQAFYGIKDSLNIPASRDLVSVGSPAITTPAAQTQSGLLNTTNIRVFTNGEITDSSGSPVSAGSPSVTIPTFNALVSVVDQDFSGWYNNLALTGPSTRNVNEPARVSNLVLWTEFTPATSSSCDAGDSFLSVKHFNTGTAAPFSPVGTDPTIVHNSADMVLAGVSLGPGLSSSPVIHSGSGGVTVITQGSTGAIGGDIVTLQPSQPGRQSWRQIFDF